MINNISKQIDNSLSKLGFSLAALLFTSSSMAVTLSNEELQQYGPEEAYWVVTVDCEDDTPNRVIHRKTDGNEWCAKDFDGFCGGTKDATSEKVCGADYTAQLEAQQLEAEAEAERRREEQAQRDAERRREAQAREQQAQARQAAAQQAEIQNQISVDEELLRIEQEKLSLRRQELELQKRAVEIREALEDLDEAE